MNRRNFLSTALKVVAAFSILPAATTYSRKWVKSTNSSLYIVTPEWVNAKYEMQLLVNWSVKTFVEPFKGNSEHIRYTINENGIFQKVEKYV